MSKSWNVVMCSLASLWMACSGGLEDPTQPDPAGEMRLSVSGLTAQQLDSLVIRVQPANVSQALSYSATTDTFVGTLVLPVGAQSLTAQGYVDDGAGNPMLVASGSASVDVIGGARVTVLMRLQDLTPPVPQPDIAPFIRSASITGTPRVNELIGLSVSAIDLDGDPLTYQWTSNCPTSVFTQPTSFYTQWGTRDAGPCRLQVTVTARGVTVSQSINVNVAALTTPQTGEVDVEAEYIARPLVTAIHIQGPGLSARQFLRQDAVTRLPFVGPNRTFQVEFFVDYGNGHGTRTATLESTCGTVVRGTDTCATSPAPATCSVQYAWTTPALPSPTCVVKARATNGTLADSFAIGTMVDWVP
ncbi:hypothetical protein HUW62_05540 [Myxococcus sp. AM011]|uniref:hypothetical protein n=1 Tax=Myxococcus sp. AM011 TaxID=2745200 RepID=UPI001595E9DC|nr:hypothetical protein [Myxococcus sp. AM011]NVJ20676.1 hypothetical protein [Myxococcus sp. AM011]